MANFSRLKILIGMFLVQPSFSKFEYIIKIKASKKSLGGSPYGQRDPRGPRNPYKSLNLKNQDLGLKSP